MGYVFGFHGFYNYRIFLNVVLNYIFTVTSLILAFIGYSLKTLLYLLSYPGTYFLVFRIIFPLICKLIFYGNLCHLIFIVIHIYIRLHIYNVISYLLYLHR